MRLIIGVDIDGVLAAFEAGYAPLLTQQTGIAFPRLGTAGWPDVWYWDREAGVEKKDEDAVWRTIEESDRFWYNLPALPGTKEFLQDLWGLDQDVYFITSRVGRRVKQQTENWLVLWGFHAPTVLISSKKADCCRALGVDLYIDDRVENCEDVRDSAPKTKGFMLAKPWNRPIHSVPRLPGLGDFLEEIRKEQIFGKGQS